MSSFLTMLLSGGATGLLGTVLTGVLSVWQKKQRHDQLLSLREMDLKELELEIASSEKIAAINVEAAARKGSYEDSRSFITASMALNSGQRWVVTIVDAVRGLMRPVLTLLLVVLAFMNGVITEEVTTYLTTTVVTWWFGTRPIEKSMAK